MAWAYFDTSALVKRYIDEPGRRDVLRLLRTHDCVISAILPVELRSALRRRVGMRNIDERSVTDVLQRLATDRDFWTLIGVTGEVLTQAESVIAAHPLRTLDAIHVASAQLFAKRINASTMLFVSADVRQAEAAASIGMRVRRIGA